MNNATHHVNRTAARPCESHPRLEPASIRLETGSLSCPLPFSLSLSPVPSLLIFRLLFPSSRHFRSVSLAPFPPFPLYLPLYYLLPTFLSFLDSSL